MTSFVEQIVAFFRRPDTAEEVPEGVCANCWGRYEYDGQIREGLRGRHLDVQLRGEAYNFIEKFVIDHIDGIRLQSDEGRVHCAQCGRDA